MEFYFSPMKAVLLVSITLVGIFLNWRYLRKALRQIKEKNAQESNALMRALNYPLTVVWYAYLFAFFVGLSVNNLIFVS